MIRIPSKNKVGFSIRQLLTLNRSNRCYETMELNSFKKIKLLERFGFQFDCLTNLKFQSSMFVRRSMTTNALSITTNAQTNRFR